MERLCFTFALAPGMEDEYDRRHAEVWPDVLDAIRAAGFSNYSLFRRGTEVIAYAECRPTIEAALALLEQSQANAHWSTYIRSIMTRVLDESGRLFIFKEVWHLA